MSLFVGNLPTGVKEDDLQQKFNHGRFAFIEFDREVDAHEAIKRYNGRDLNGNIIVVEMSKNSRGGPSRQKEGKPRSRSRSPRSQPKILQLSQNEAPPASPQIPLEKQFSPQVQNHTIQTPEPESKIEETLKTPEVQVSMPAPPTFVPNNPQSVEQTQELTLTTPDLQDTVSVSSMHVEVASILSQSSDTAEEPKSHENEPMDIEVEIIEELKEEEKIVPPSLESHSPLKVFASSSSVPENPHQEASEALKVSPVPGNDEKVEEEVEETEHVYKEGEELEAPDGSKFRIEKLNLKNDDATQVHCMRCERSIQKKSIKGHITTKVHKGH